MLLLLHVLLLHIKSVRIEMGSPMMRGEHIPAAQIWRPVGIEPGTPMVKDMYVTTATTKEPSDEPVPNLRNGRPQW